MSTIQSKRGCQDENEPRACRRWGHSYPQPWNEVPAGGGGRSRGGRPSPAEPPGRSRPVVLVKVSELTTPPLAQLRNEAARGAQRPSPLAGQVRASPGQTTAGDSTVLPSRLPVAAAGRASIFSPWLSYLALNLQN